MNKSKTLVAIVLLSLSRILLSDIPVLAFIHSSEVSTKASKSLLERILSGMKIPVPEIFAKLNVYQT